MDGGNEQSFHKILFQSRSICDRNTSVGANGLWNEAVNRSNVLDGILDFEKGGSW